MMAIIRSKKIAVFIYVALFAFMLLCNILTMKAVDDYSYSYSFADGSRITNVFDIIPSMIAHAKGVNGRIVSHSIAQFFLMLPDWVFDIANALMFVLHIALAARISRGEGERNNLLTICIFCAIWVYELEFGQVNLWLDGACNYLWSVGCGLLFILPYVDYYLFGREVKKTVPKILFFFLSFLAGGWAESGSAAFICMAVMLAAVCYFLQHKKVPGILIAGIVFAIAGYITIFMSPAEGRKAGDFSLMGLLGGLHNCFAILGRIWPLMAACIVLTILNIYNGTDKKQMILAAVFFVGAMCAHFILMFAAGYANRVAVSATVLLIIADTILLRGVLNKGVYQPVAVCMLALLLAMTPLEVLKGMGDIHDTYSAMKANEATLIRSAEEGVEDVVLPIVEPRTKYSVIWGLWYLSAEDAYEWPNTDMARYYGVKSILGVETKNIEP